MNTRGFVAVIGALFVTLSLAASAALAVPASPASKSMSGDAMSGLGVKTVKITSPVAPGGTVKVDAQTMGNAECAITVELKSGASEAKALAPKKASGRGTVSWSWKLAATAADGKSPVTVSCKLGGKEGKAEGQLEIKKKM